MPTLPLIRLAITGTPAVTASTITFAPPSIRLAITSKSARLIVEAVTAGVPVIASRISGNVGMLGEDYPGYFTLGDATDCAAILRRAETDRVFYRRLVKACAKRAANFVPEHEATAIRASVARAELTPIAGGLSRV